MSAAYLKLLATATGLPEDQLPADPADRLAAVCARQLVESMADKRRPSKPLAPADEAHLAALLPRAFHRVGGQPWKVGDLTKGLARYGSPHRDLLVALDEIPGSIGKFLSRCKGHEAGGFRLELVDHAGNQNVWRIRPIGSKSP